MVPTPTNDKIIVSVIKEENISPTGLYIAGDRHDEPAKGKVEAIGSGMTVDGIQKDINLKIGDIVVFPKYGGTDLELEGKDYKILNFIDVLVKVDNE